MRALVVDDDLMTRIVLQEVLSRYADVHSCVDGSEAVTAYKRGLERGEPYDLICMDVLMPVMGGIEALRHIRREEEARFPGRTRPTRVVITTASDDDETIRQAFQGGLCEAYVIKPIDAEEFTGVVDCLFPLVERG